MRALRTLLGSLAESLSELVPVVLVVLSVASFALPTSWMRLTSSGLFAALGLVVIVLNWGFVVQSVRTRRFHSSIPIFGALLVFPFQIGLSVSLGLSNFVTTCTGFAVALLDPGCLGSFWMGPLIWWIWGAPADSQESTDDVETRTNGPA